MQSIKEKEVVINHAAGNKKRLLTLAAIIDDFNNLKDFISVKTADCVKDIIEKVKSMLRGLV